MAAVLTVQEPEGSAKKKAPAKHIWPDTPGADLDNVDRCRRAFAREWGKMYGGNGTIYADDPGADRDLVGKFFQHHRAAKIPRPLDDWMYHVFRVYLAIDEPFLRENVHALRFLRGCKQRVFQMVDKEFAEESKEEKATRG